MYWSVSDWVVWQLPTCRDGGMCVWHCNPFPPPPLSMTTATMGKDDSVVFPSLVDVREVPYPHCNFVRVAVPSYRFFPIVPIAGNRFLLVVVVVVRCCPSPPLVPLMPSWHSPLPQLLSS